MKQQFFFVSAALQDIIRRYKISNKDITELDKSGYSVKRSRCALAIPELMRILIDKENSPGIKPGKSPALPTPALPLIKKTLKPGQSTSGSDPASAHADTF